MAESGELRRPRWFWNAFLFAGTLLTTFLAGFRSGNPLVDPLVAGFLYMASVMTILVSHEMGHYLLARRNRVDASLPYFLPVPLPLVGTLGAVIVMKGRIRSRDALMEVGAAGPIAGVIVAIPVLIIGLRLSPVLPLSPPAILEGQSLLYMLLKWVAAGPIPPGHDVFLHPVAWAGWVGLLLTMINLLPVGQLDGGHVMYALFGPRHGSISRVVIIAIIALGVLVIGHGAWLAWSRGLTGEPFWMAVASRNNWFVWGVLLYLVFGRGRRAAHPPTDDDRLGAGHRAIGFACVLLFFVTFSPVPLQFLI
jgi:membrane-associated protease RseP (regulator of RpoE activity)